LLGGGFLFSTTAPAQLNPVNPPVIDHCIEEAVASDLNCTANDVSLGLLVVDDPNAQCEETFPGSGVFTADVQFQAQLTSGAKERYDIGMYIALDGGDARTGVCARNYLPPNPDPLANPGDPGSEGLGNGVGPHLTVEDAADACGDLPQNTVWYYDLLELNPATFKPVEPETLGVYTIQCVDTNGDGTVDIGTCTSWDNGKRETCLDASDAFPNTKAKCRCERTETTLNQPGFLTVEKVCVPSDDDGSFTIRVDGDALPTFACGDTSETIVVPVVGGVPTDLVVSEDSPGADYGTPVYGGDCDASGNVSVDSGETKNCTVTNTRVICPVGHSCASDVCGSFACDPGGEPLNCDIPTYASASTICNAGSGDICDPDETCSGNADEACPIGRASGRERV
jgi:hypothetical protein